MNELQNKIEGTLITRTFHVGGMPEIVFKELDTYCKEHYGDSRWTMIADLHRMAKEDYKFSLLYDEVITLKGAIAELKVEPQQPVKKGVSTFGRSVSIDDLEKGELK